MKRRFHVTLVSLNLVPPAASVFGVMIGMVTLHVVHWNNTILKWLVFVESAGTALTQ